MRQMPNPLKTTELVGELGHIVVRGPLLAPREVADGSPDADEPQPRKDGLAALADRRAGVPLVSRITRSLATRPLTAFLDDPERVSVLVSVRLAILCPSSQLDAMHDLQTPNDFSV